jgi:ribosomal protein S18 acetylase RimI-like enzyme
MPEIRELTIADYDRITWIWKEAGLPYRPEGRDSQKEMAEQMQRFPDLFIGAFEDSELVGLCIGTDEGRKGWINRLAVHPKHRRKGIGTMLLQEMERILRKRGLNVLSALIEDWNTSSLAFFEKCGYEIHKDIVYVSKRESERV